MLVQRVFTPKPEEVFYHYCSTETFLAIAENKTLRFSDANMMNDIAESRYGYEIFERAATAILKDDEFKKHLPDIDVAFFEKVDGLIAPQQLHSHPVIACFSRLPDVLSQWRAYGDDGRGFSLGFSGKVLKALPVTLLEVEYDPANQLTEMKTALAATYLRNLESKESFGSKFKQDCLLLGWWKYGFKHPSFAEEKEIRCLHLLDVVTKGDRPRLVDAGGESGGKRVAGVPVKYRSASGSIVAYIDMPLPSKEEVLIAQVWKGPKNGNGPGNIAYPLGGHGTKGFTMHSSASTYQ